MVNANGHWFWWLLWMSTMLWYVSVTFYITYRGWKDIWEMLRRLREQAPLED